MRKIIIVIGILLQTVITLNIVGQFSDYTLGFPILNMMSQNQILSVTYYKIDTHENSQIFFDLHGNSFNGITFNDKICKKQRVLTVDPVIKTVCILSNNLTAYAHLGNSIFSWNKNQYLWDTFLFNNNDILFAHNNSICLRNSSNFLSNNCNSAMGFTAIEAKGTINAFSNVYLAGIDGNIYQVYYNDLSFSINQIRMNNLSSLSGPAITQVKQMIISTDSLYLIAYNSAGNILILKRSTMTEVSRYLHSQQIFFVKEYEGFLIISDASGTLWKYNYISDQMLGSLSFSKQVLNLTSPIQAFTTNSTYMFPTLNNITSFKIFISEVFNNGSIYVANQWDTVITEVSVFNNIINNTGSNPTNNSTQSTSNSTQTSSNATNNTIPETNTTNKTQLVCVSPYLKVNDKCQYSATLARVSQASVVLGSTVSLPSVRTTLRILNPLFIFVEDLWFYSYHNCNYSDFMGLVFDQVNSVSSQWFMPSWLNEDQLKSMLGLDRFFNDDYATVTPQSVKEDQQYLYFLKNTQQIYTWNMIFNILTFVLLAILHQLFKRIFQGNQNIVIKKIREFLHEKSLFFLLWVNIIQSNLIYLSFFSFLQIKNPYLFRPMDKLDLIITYLYSYACILYAVGFYALVFSYYPKYEASNLLTVTNHKWLSSYWFETMINGFRNFINGFLHAYLINNYHSQIVALVIVNLGIFILILSLRKNYTSKILLVLSLLYQFSILGLTCTFALEEFITSLSLDRYQYVQIGFVLGIMLSCILKIFYQVVCSIWIVIAALFNLIIKKNKVKDQSESKTPQCIQNNQGKIRQNCEISYPEENQVSIQPKTSIKKLQFNLTQNANKSTKTQKSLKTRKKIIYSNNKIDQKLKQQTSIKNIDTNTQKYLPNAIKSKKEVKLCPEIRMKERSLHQIQKNNDNQIS